MGFNEPEQAVMERTAVGFRLALAQDQVSTLFPEQPSRFKSYEDVVEKLVPYHIWQVCDEELDGQEGGSEIKRKQIEVRGTFCLSMRTCSPIWEEEKVLMRKKRMRLPTFSRE
jgi:hypothetical protein